jgi:glycine/D-amino acid oxidase-like deaminating enzyme
MGADEQSDYGPTWYSGVTRLPPARTPLNYDLDVDVCVIGGGLAGLTAAREVARRGWSVAVIEARRIAWNASGRNSGFVAPGYSAQIEKIVERIGLPAAKALWELSEAGVQYVRDTIEESGVSGIVEGEGWLDVFKTPDTGRASARIRLLDHEIGAAAESWPPERVRDALRTSHYFEAIYFPHAFQINPLAYALGLADAAERAGVRMFENTQAVTVDPAGVRKRIETPHGRVRAGHVVLAGNIHLGAVAQRLADTLVPITAFTGVTQSLGGRLAEAVAFRGAVSDSRHANYHYRIVGGDRLLWTGSTSVGSRSKRTQRWLERAVRATYPQLGPVQFEYFWPAEMGFAVHGMPQIGEVQPGVWLASAFGGHGLNTSAMAGNLIARAVVEGDDTWRRFLPFELVWAGGRVGRSVVRATAWWRHQSEAMAALAVRQREELRRKRQERKQGAGPAKVASGFNFKQAAALKRALKGSFAATEHDRPIDAPEAMPSTGLDTASGPPRPERTGAP